MTARKTAALKRVCAASVAASAVAASAVVVAAAFHPLIVFVSSQQANCRSWPAAVMRSALHSLLTQACSIFRRYVRVHMCVLAWLLLVHMHRFEPRVHALRALALCGGWITNWVQIDDSLSDVEASVVGDLQLSSSLNVSVNSAALSENTHFAHTLCTHTLHTHTHTRTHTRTHTHTQAHTHTHTKHAPFCWLVGRFIPARHLLRPWTAISQP